MMLILQLIASNSARFFAYSIALINAVSASFDTEVALLKFLPADGLVRAQRFK